MKTKKDSINEIIKQIRHDEELILKYIELNKDTTELEINILNNHSLLAKVRNM